VDLGMFILTVEFLYLFYTGFPPSLIRAYFMEVIFFIFAFLFEDVLSVKVLFFTVLFGLLIFTFGILSIGFLLSVLGVYYIYLFLRYFKISWKNTPLLSVYMFLMMFVWSHYFFGQFNNYQFFSPVFNLLFPFFYVIEILLHVLGIGGLFDGLIKDLLDLGKNFYYVKFELPVLLIFALLSILAYKKKPAFYGINLLAFILVFSSVRI
jgi:competence protein ComEC